ncbi:MULTISPECIES: hypothetical protein [Parachlamydia]|jgi:hypothetical protein|uniref:Uncharacterized protein n=2 Tax=Parachlamydia acanthamoebae TaxID=83552 RepID=F8KW28_PARAV|nr:hypothetical protein [Parachlamydia acanthamoebae]KIA76201.1 hypothetical protein DB43_AQ00070 [Parachlamydia acanthamoebae]CCB85297.1 unknown protein [Parachlamydia acanthamoebae UV-7]
MKINSRNGVDFFDLNDDSKLKNTENSKSQKKYRKDEEDLYDLDLRIKETVNDLHLVETGGTWNCTGTGRCSRGCQTNRGQTCVRCGPTEYTTCGSCRCP